MVRAAVFSCWSASVAACSTTSSYTIPTVTRRLCISWACASKFLRGRSRLGVYSPDHHRNHLAVAQTAVTKQGKSRERCVSGLPERYWLLLFNRAASPDARASVL